MILFDAATPANAGASIAVHVHVSLGTTSVEG